MPHIKVTSKPPSTRHDEFIPELAHHLSNTVSSKAKNQSSKIPDNSVTIHSKRSNSETPHKIHIKIAINQTCIPESRSSFKHSSKTNEPQMHLNCPHLALHSSLMIDINPVSAFLLPRLLGFLLAATTIIGMMPGLREDGNAARAGTGSEVVRVPVDAVDERCNWSVDAAGSRFVLLFGGQALQHRLLAIVEARHGVTSDARNSPTKTSSDAKIQSLQNPKPLVSQLPVGWGTLIWGFWAHVSCGIRLFHVVDLRSGYYQNCCTALRDAYPKPLLYPKTGIIYASCGFHDVKCTARVDDVGFGGTVTVYGIYIQEIYVIPLFTYYKQRPLLL